MPISVTMGYILFCTVSGSLKGDKMFELVPDEMKSMPNWVLWKFVGRNGKLTKVPYQPDGREARMDDQETWSYFDRTDFLNDEYGLHGYCILNRLKANDDFDGIGFVFTKQSGLVGVDFDHVRDPVTGEWNSDDVMDALSLNSYTEISPSGDGLHVICKGKKPSSACKAGNHEMYDSGRYFTVTGKMFPGCNPAISKSQNAINRLYSKWFSFRECKPVPSRVNSCFKRHIVEPANDCQIPLELADIDIIGICNHAKNSSKFKKLFSGDWSGYPSQSEADFALCRILAFYSSDPGQIERIMRSSGLARAKWNRPGYLSTTVRNALNAGGAKYAR